MVNRWAKSRNSDRLYFLEINVYDGCSHEIKRHLLGRKVMTKLDSLLKSRDISLATKVCLVKTMVFPVVMYGCKNWTIKKAEHQRIDAFEVWCLSRLLRVLGLQGDPTRSILNWCWSWNCSTLATDLKNWLIGKDWCWERLKARGEGNDRGWGGWMASLTQWTWVWASPGSWWWTGKPGVLQSIGLQRVGHYWANELNLGVYAVVHTVPNYGKLLSVFK